MSPRAPAIFIGHGSPMNALEDNEFSAAWARLGRRIPRPAAVVCLSAHWETDGLFVTSSDSPTTIHDFSGFPEALFRVRYPARGAPELAAEVATLTRARLEPARGLDHGAWSVLCRMWPEAEVPVLQLSLDRTRSAQELLALGVRLAPLREKNVLLLGSGNLVHNLGAISWRAQSGFAWAEEFTAALRPLLTAGDAESLADWTSIGPAARLAVPTREHYIPVLPILGARAPREALTLFCDRVVLGSIGMISVMAGDSTLVA